MRILFYLHLCCIHKNILSGQLTMKAFSLCCVANPCLHSLTTCYYISVIFFSALCPFTSINICSLSLFTKSTSTFILIYIFLFVDTMQMFTNLIVVEPYPSHFIFRLQLSMHISLLKILKRSFG